MTRCPHRPELAMRDCNDCLVALLAEFVGPDVVLRRGYGCPYRQSADWQTYNCGQCRDCRARAAIAETAAEGG